VCRFASFHSLSEKREKIQTVRPKGAAIGVGLVGFLITGNASSPEITKIIVSLGRALTIACKKIGKVWHTFWCSHLLSVQQTPGVLPRLYTGSRTRLQHPRQDQAEEISSLRNQRADQEDQGQPKEQDTTKEKPPLPGRRAWRGRGCPEDKSQDCPGRLTGDAEGGLPRQGDDEDIPGSPHLSSSPHHKSQLSNEAATKKTYLGPMTRSRAKHIEQEVNVLLANHTSTIHENFILPKSSVLILLRYNIEDNQQLSAHEETSSAHEETSSEAHTTSLKRTSFNSDVNHVLVTRATNYASRKNSKPSQQSIVACTVSEFVPELAASCNTNI
jgi:hypothetical protein